MNIAARPAAFAGSYADLKFIKSRSVFQVIVEMPIEQADAFLAAFKAPQPGQEQPVALALLNPSSIPSVSLPGKQADESAPVEAGPREAPAAEGPGLPKREAPQRCPTAAPDKVVQLLGITCGDPRFQMWLKNYVGLSGDDLDHQSAEICMRQLLGVKSRAEIATNPVARQKALDLMTDYDIHIGKHAKDYTA